MKSKKVLLITESYPPILGSAGRLFSELAESLTGRGYEVTVLTEIPNRHMSGEDYKGKVFVREFSKGIRIVRLPSFLFLRRFLPLRYLEQFIKMIEFLLVGLFAKHEGGVIIYSPPLPLAAVGILLAKYYKTKAIVNIQDLYPETPILLGVMKSRLITNISKKLEMWVYKSADFITVHSVGNKDYVVNRGTWPDKVWVIPNWIDLKKYSAGSKANQFRRRFGLDNKFVVSFAGIIGFAQGVEEVIDAAKILCEYEKIFFVLAGGGLNYKALKEKAEKEKLKNILFLPHLPENEYVELLRASDVCLVTLHKNLKTPVVPGKLQSIMAVGRPVICVVPYTSDARAIVHEAGCGVWVEPGDVGGLTRAILSLFESYSLEEMGRNGRIYVERFHDRQKCVDTYDKILQLFRIEVSR